jgi:hypothetical protein
VIYSTAACCEAKSHETQFFGPGTPHGRHMRSGVLLHLLLVLCLANLAVPLRTVTMGPKKTATHPGVADKAISKKKEAPAPAAAAVDTDGAVVIEAW